MKIRLADLPLCLDAKTTIAAVIVRSLIEWNHPQDLTDRMALARLCEHGLVDMNDDGTFTLSDKCISRVFYDILVPYFKFEVSEGKVIGEDSLKEDV